jgi:hypothetical protein
MVNPDTGEDTDLGATSGFVSFGVNGDSSVLVGASRNQAGPYILLKLRSIRSELPLCEHKASRAEDVRPVFTPNSQRILFATDRHGKWAIHAMQVDKLVEKTEEELEERSSR